MPPAASIATLRASILVIDDSQLYRQLTTELLRSQGFDIVEAADGESGFAQLQRRRIDLIILDNLMPGMNGLAFLTRLRADPKLSEIPVIMLTSGSDKNTVVEAMRLGVRDYMIKSRDSIPGMISRVRSAIAKTPARTAAHAATPAGSAGHISTTPPQSRAINAASAPGSANTKSVAHPPAASGARGSAVAASSNVGGLERKDVVSAIEETAGTRTLAGIVAEVLALANSPHSGLSDLTAILKRDPVMTSRVVQLACSSAYGGSKSKLTTIDEAVRVVGAAGVRDLALTVGIFDSFPAGKADGLDLLRCWQHTFAVAAAMEKIVPRGDGLPPGAAHLVGLCQGLGEIVLRQRFPRQCAAAAILARRANGPFARQIPAVFGITMTEVMQILLGKMKLPAAIFDPIVEFTRSDDASADASLSALARALAIANSFSHALGLTSSADEKISPVLLSDCATALLPTGKIDWTNLRAQAAGTICTLAKVKAADQAALLSPLIAKSAGRIGYFRHSSFAALDPIEAAIDTLCVGEVFDGLPGAEDLQRLQGLIVLSPARDASGITEILRLRALTGVDVPILHLTSSKMQSTTPAGPGVQELQYPLTLRAFSAFAATPLRPAA